MSVWPDRSEPILPTFETNMKNFLPPISLLLFLLAPFLMLQAQPVITSNAMVQIGESAPVQFVSDGFNPGMGGANVAWDFSQLQDDTLGFTWEALSPATSPFVDSFPNANLAFKSPVQNGLQENWIYYDWDATAETLNLHGSAAIITDSASQDTFYYVLTANPKLVQTFPFTNGDSYTDNFTGRNTISISNFTLVQTRNGSITVEADGYGSLVTPAGTFQNVLRIKTTELITDTYMGFGTDQTITRYTWYSADEKYLLLHMDSIVIQPTGGPASYTESVFYRSGAPLVSVDEAQIADQWEMEVFPNPIASGSNQNQVQIRYRLDDPQPARIVLRNLIGQQLESIEAGPGSQLKSLDLQGISPGIYTLQLIQGEKTATRKLILR
jgi:hypothetical protein